MKLVLLSGGSGKRLWPLSNQTRSKQFLKLLPDGHGGYESMVQRVFRQIKSVYRDAEVIVTAGAEQASVISSQLGSDIHTVLEPSRRDTYPAIMLAASYLWDRDKGKSPNESVVFLPIDAYTDTDFFVKVGELSELSQNKGCNIALLGITPTYPSEKYGYILPKAGQTKEPFNVEAFCEKPPLDKAKSLIKRGAFWNGGVFAVRLSYLISMLESKYNTAAFDEILGRYDELEKTSFDCAVVEKEDNILMLSYSGKWKDLGTWNTLTEEIGQKIIGEAITGLGTENTCIINELSIPVVALGVKNTVIAASPDGILVSDLNQSSFMKPYVDQIEQRPMYEEREWGNYKVIDYEKYENGLHSLTKHMTIEPGAALSYQSHGNRDEIWTIVDGTADLLIDGHIRNVRPGDVVYILKGQKHSIRAITPLHFIEVQLGDDLIEDDIVKFEWNWDGTT